MLVEAYVVGALVILIAEFFTVLLVAACWFHRKDR